MPALDYVRIARCIGRRDPAGLEAALRALEEPPEAIATMLRRHQLIGMIGRTLPHGLGGLPEPLASTMRAQSVPAPELAELMAVWNEVHGALGTADVRSRLLKGAALGARLYGDPSLRPQHDVDVLVRRRDFARARRVLRNLGFRSAGRDLHSRTFERGRLKVDLHWCLRWAPAYRIDETCVWEGATSGMAVGVAFETLTDEWTLVLLALAAFEDLGQGMAKLKQLLDLHLCCAQVEKGVGLASFLAARKPEGIDGAVAAALGVARELFEHETTEPEALALTFADRKAPANLEWFARSYPGNLAHYLAWFWLGGFPGNLRTLAAAHPLRSLRLALRR